MRKEWSSPEHVGKIVISHLHLLSGEFHKKMKEPDEEKDYDLIIKLSSAAGYQAQLYSGIQKQHEFARRLQRIEKELTTSHDPNSLLSKNPVINAEVDLQVQDSLK